MRFFDFKLKDKVASDAAGGVPGVGRGERRNCSNTRDKFPFIFSAPAV
jgi:hypothetical protein